jgi:rhodanese-related sulfurtransferase
MEPSRINPVQAKSEIDRGKEILFIDTRNEKAWAQSNWKLPGAMRIPAGEIELKSHLLPRDKLIVTYCA